MHRCTMQAEQGYLCGGEDQLPIGKEEWGTVGITASYNGQVLGQSLLYPRQHSYSPTQPFPTSGHEDCDVVFPVMVLCM